MTPGEYHAVLGIHVLDLYLAPTREQAHAERLVEHGLAGERTDLSRRREVVEIRLRPVPSQVDIRFGLAVPVVRPGEHQVEAARAGVEVVGEELDLLEVARSREHVLAFDQTRDLVRDRDIPGQRDAVFDGNIEVVERQIQLLGELDHDAEREVEGLFLGELLAAQGGRDGICSRQLTRLDQAAFAGERRSQDAEIRLPRRRGPEARVLAVERREIRSVTRHSAESLPLRVSPKSS